MPQGSAGQSQKEAAGRGQVRHIADSACRDNPPSHRQGGCSTLISLAALERETHVDRRTCSRILQLCASHILQAEWGAFSELLKALKAGQDAGRYNPLHFAWLRMYDETPGRARTHLLGDRGGMEQSTVIAKIMACQLRFSFLYEVLPHGPDRTHDLAPRSFPGGLPHSQTAAPSPGACRAPRPSAPSQRLQGLAVLAASLHLCQWCLQGLAVLAASPRPSQQHLQGLAVLAASPRANSVWCTGPSEAPWPQWPNKQPPS